MNKGGLKISPSALASTSARTKAACPALMALQSGRIPVMSASVDRIARALSSFEPNGTRNNHSYACIWDSSALTVIAATRLDPCKNKSKHFAVDMGSRQRRSGNSHLGCL